MNHSNSSFQLDSKRFYIPRIYANIWHNYVFDNTLISEYKHQTICYIVCAYS